MAKSLKYSSVNSDGSTVGVLAVTGGSWNGIWTTRHFMLSNLAHYFRVAWLEPPVHWRGVRSSLGSTSAKSTEMEVRYVETSGLPGVTKVQPLAALPDFYRPARIRRAVRAKRYQLGARSLRHAGCERVLLHIWRPEFVDALDSRAYFDGVIYHIDDDYSFSDTLEPISMAEQRLLEEADAVILHSPGLADRKGAINKATYMVSNGVDFELYSQSFAVPADLMNIPGPRVGYAGVIRSHLDISLIRELAERRPDWSFVLVGPLGHLGRYEAEISRMEQLPNVYFLGYRDPGELPAYEQHFDVCIMPYRQTTYTDCINPLKLYEYLACGKPVVGAPIRTLRDFDHVISLACGVEDWVEKIELCLSSEFGEQQKVSNRRSVASNYDWKWLAGQTALIMGSVIGGDTQQRVTKQLELLSKSGDLKVPDISELRVKSSD